MENLIIEEDLKFITDSHLPWRMLEGKNILISGANGLLPSYLVKTILFLNKNKFKKRAKVFAVDMANNRLASYQNRNDLVFINQDICKPIAIDGNIHFIIHAASKASPKYFGKDPVGTLSANIFGTKNLLEFARTKKVENFLFFSSGEVYGNIYGKNTTIKEDSFGYLDPTNVRSCYAESKRMGETMCASWFHQYSVPAKIVRPFHTYGPGTALDDGRVFADFVSDIINKRNIVMKSDGKAVRAFCYIADATVGFFTVLLKGENGQAYNVGNPEAKTTVLNLAHVLVGLFPEKKLKVIKSRLQDSRGSSIKSGQDITDKGYIKSEFNRQIPDISKIVMLGWKPKYSLKDGFMRMIESYE